MRDPKTGQRLRDPDYYYGQKTLLNYNLPKPNFYYGNVNLKYPEGKYRWREIGTGDSEREILMRLRESISHYYPSGGYVLREDPEDMTIRKAHQYSIGKMMRHKYVSDILGSNRKSHSDSKFIYVYYQREEYRGRHSFPFIIDYKGRKTSIFNWDYDPYA